MLINTRLGFGERTSGGAGTSGSSTSRSRPSAGDAARSGPLLSAPDQDAGEEAKDSNSAKSSSRGNIFSRRANYAPAADADLPRFVDLEDLEAPLRSQRLGGALYTQHALPRRPARAVTLAQTLRGTTSTNRYDVIDNYWTASEKLALYQALVEAKGQLDALTPAAARLGRTAGGDVAMVRLQAAKKAIQAALVDTEISVVETSYDLTNAVGQSLGSAWLRPTTAPHAGGYRLVLSVQPAPLAASKRLGQRATPVTVYFDRLKHLSGAVVFTDKSRSEAMGKSNMGVDDLNWAIGTVLSQAEWTRQYIRTATRYNRAIAEYALAVLPANASLDKLVGALVIARPSSNRS
jgi:hypothetical protein